MHLLFSKAAKYPEKVDEDVNSGTEEHEERLNFSNVFHKLFPTDRKIHRHMKSFLSTFSGFDIRSQTIEKELLPTPEDEQIVKQLYKKFSIRKATKDGGVFQFWTCLVKLYREILGSPGNHLNNFHNIFEFMNAFPIEKTRVVIIGHDPSPNCESTGYAFHGSICMSTKNLIKHLNSELKFVDDYLDEESLEISQENLQTYLDSCQLNGWIQQGVLMINSCFTRGHKLWKYVSGFLIKYLSDTFSHLVFILAGDKDHQVSIIDKSKHLVFSFEHPGNNYNIGLWTYKLPFLRANFLLYQLSLQDPTYTMINWAKISGQEDSEIYITKLEELFKELHEQASNIPECILHIAGDFVKPNPMRSPEDKDSLLLKKRNGFFDFIYHDALKDDRQFYFSKVREYEKLHANSAEDTFKTKNNMGRTLLHEAFSRGYMDVKWFDRFINMSGDLNHVDKKGHSILQTVRAINVDQEVHLPLLGTAITAERMEYYINKLIKLGAKETLDSDEVKALPNKTSSTKRKMKCQSSQNTQNKTKEQQTRSIDKAHQSTKKKSKTE